MDAYGSWHLQIQLLDKWKIHHRELLGGNIPQRDAIPVTASPIIQLIASSIWSWSSSLFKTLNPTKQQFGHDTSLQYHLHWVHDELKLLGIWFLLPSHTTFALHASGGPSRAGKPSRAGLNDPHLSMTLASKNRPSISAVSPVTTIPAWMGKRKYASFIFDSLTDGSPQIHLELEKKPHRIPPISNDLFFVSCNTRSACHTTWNIMWTSLNH